jgi:hypothetical protein
VARDAALVAAETQHQQDKAAAVAVFRAANADDFHPF